MAEKPQPKSGKKVVDKWKTKQWYNVVAPEIFEGKVVSEIVASDPATLINRVVPVNLMDITGKMSQQNIYTTVKFRITEVKGNNAYTRVIGHELAPSYIRTLARKGRSVIHHVIPVDTKDGKKVKVKIIAITFSKVSSTTKKNLRNALVKAVLDNGKAMSYDELMKEIIYGNFANKLFSIANAINAMRRVEVRKTELEETFQAVA
jgi:small subunit ribosomal protein S3Ae